MNDKVCEQLETACWVAHSLFERGKATGSSANLSLMAGDHVFITSSGTCFGRLTPEDFTEIDAAGQVVAGRKPSKELPLHLTVYQAQPQTKAVLHVHSRACVLWSCLGFPDETDIVPSYTPYLKMKVGRIGLVPYAPPGSEALFAAFAARAGKSDGWLLAHHGPVVGGKDILSAFYGLEELEESCAIAWDLQGKNVTTIEGKR